MRRKAHFVATIMLLATAYILPGALMIFLIYKMIFEPVSFWFAITVSSAGFLSSFVSLTPASLGIREAVISYTATLMGNDFTASLAVASLNRAVALIWVFALGVFFSAWYAKKIS